VLEREASLVLTPVDSSKFSFESRIIGTVVLELEEFRERSSCVTRLRMHTLALKLRGACLRPVNYAQNTKEKLKTL
jgi:hypothetical protein